MSTLKITTWTMPAASMGKPNPLPDLKNASDPHAKIEIDYETVTPDEAKYMGWGRVNTILPYTIQDGYGRSRRKRDFKAFVLENEHLKATFLPELGGRLWSLFDKDAQRELLHVNPVFQPCNLALRNAWISGGVEWNLGIIGHTPFTVDDMACQRLSLSDGTPVLRMFQYERVRHLFYRVEAMLPDGAKELYVRVRIDNATNEDTAVYWWSNMAVNEGENVRVIAPAQKAYRYGYGGKLSKVQVPYMVAEADKLQGQAARLARENGGKLDWDISKTTTLPQALDFFFDVPNDVRPFIAAIGADGYGMCQTSTPELLGRKLFVWGMGTGGRHWQTFLSKKGSAYIELQSGLAHTQLEHLPMEGGASISWLESYGAVQTNPEKSHAHSWETAVKEVDAALRSVRPEEPLLELHERIKRELDEANGEVLHKGMGFARVEKELLGDAFDTGHLKLEAMRLGKEEEPWMALCQTGALPCPKPLDEPSSYQIGKHWEEKLSRSIAEGKSNHWFGYYQLGVMRAARGADAEARRDFEQSLQCANNPWALRCLALLDGREGKAELAAERMCEAVVLRPIRSLVIEALDWLSKTEQYERMSLLIERLPQAIRGLGRVKTYEMLTLMRAGKYEQAQELLESKIVLTDVREGEVLITDLWFELMSRIRFGDASEEHLAWVNEKLKPPQNIDFRMN